MPESDRTLVRKTLAGERDAFGALVERYSPLVHGLLLEAVRRPDEVEDLAQEAFCKAYEELPRLRRPGQFAPWLSRIAANMAVNWHRRRQVRTNAEEEGRLLHLYEYAATQDDQYESRAMAQALWEALDRLIPEYRRIIVLHHVEGCSYRDIAKFLNLNISTVRWRLRKAARLLKQDLAETHYQQLGLAGRNRRQAREKVMSALPVLPFFPRPEPVGWLGRAALLLGCVGALGLGGALWERVGELPAREIEASGGFRVQRRAVELPAVSAVWSPPKPRAGEAVRIEVAGLSAAEGEPYAELHYIIDPWHPLDRVVPMRREGDIWVAEVEVPADAPALFFYATGEEEGPQELHRGSPLTAKRRMGRYAHSIVVHDAERRPARGAALARALLADRQGRPPGEVGARADQEIARYPDNFNAYEVRWRTMLAAADRSPESLARVRAEQDEVFAHYPDRPEALWWASMVPSPRQRELQQRLYEGFPSYKYAEETAFQVAMSHVYGGEDRLALTALAAFERRFPDSRYADEVLRWRLGSLANIDPGRAAIMADSLIEVASSARRGEQWDTRHMIGGTLPQGLAFSVRFDQLLRAGREEQALALAERLAGSGLPDVNAYLYLGGKLAGEPGRSVLAGAPPAYPLDLGLAADVLAAGLVQATLEDTLGSPDFSRSPPWPIHYQERLRRVYRDHVRARRRIALRALGGCLLRLEAYEAAARHLEEAGDLGERIGFFNPAEDDAMLLLAEAYEGLGRWRPAEQTYLEVIGQRITSLRAETALARMHRARYGHLRHLPRRLATHYPLAPRFAATDGDGGKVALEDFRGRVLLLYYDTYDTASAWKPPEASLARLRALADWRARWANRGLAVLHVSSTPHPLSSPLPALLDEGSVADGYGARTTTLYLVDPAGRLRLKQEFWPARVDKSWTGAVEGKIAEVLGQRPRLAEGD